MTDVPHSVLLVVNGYATAHDLRHSLPPGWVVLPFCGALLGYRFDLILLPKFDDEGSEMRRAQAQQWLRENLSIKLAPGGKIVRI
jgi:hypothetical protein